MRNNKNEFNLWGDWNVCTFELLWLFFGKEVVFSKTYPSFLTLKEGSTSHLGLLPSGKKRETALSAAFSKITPSLFTIKEGSTSHPDPLTLREEGGNRSSSSLGTATL